MSNPHYRLHLVRTSPRGTALWPSFPRLPFQKCVQIFGRSERHAAVSKTVVYSERSPLVSSWSSLETTICKSNSSGLSAAMRRICWHSPAQSSSRQPRKGLLPEMVKSKYMFVVLLGEGIRLRTVLMSWRTEGVLASPSIVAISENTRRFEWLVRFTSPARGI